MNQKNEGKSDCRNAKNGNLTAARANKNDEFYTQYADIEAEINAYVEHNPDVFRGKTILLPCDDHEWSNFTKYFAFNFERLGLKKLISTSYAKGASNKQLTLFESESPLFDKEKHETHGKLFVLTHDRNGSGNIDTDDIEFSGYLEGDGDFRSEEVTRLRDEADFIVTNPPFSLFREFLAWIMAGKKKFSIIGNMNAIKYKEVFPLIKNNEIWLGHMGAMTFRKPDGVEPFAKLGNVCWFTNIDYSKHHEFLQLDTMEHNLKYNKKLQKKLLDSFGTVEYPHYDYYDAIEVPMVECIPSDYDGVMGVPITFLDKHNPEQFEIVTFRKGEDGKDLVFTREREREFNLTFESLSDTDCSDGWKTSKLKQWKDYLRLSDGNQKYKEPIDLFFPISTDLKNGLINGATVGGRKTFCRILIRSVKRR